MGETYTPYPRYVICDECAREFDLTDETDAEEWFYGHDCE